METMAQLLFLVDLDRFQVAEGVSVFYEESYLRRVKGLAEIGPLAREVFVSNEYNRFLTARPRPSNGNQLLHGGNQIRYSSMPERSMYYVASHFTVPW
jgi:hypothetical protein